MEDAKITGSLMFHKVLVSSKSSVEEGIALYTGSGSGSVLRCDTFILIGQKRTGGYTITLPPARYFLGAKIKIINSTYAMGSHTFELTPSPIHLEVNNGTTPNYDTDIEENIKNTIVSAVPFEFFNGNSNNYLVGAPFSNYATSNGGLLPSTSTLYKSIELIAAYNQFAGDGTDCAWMIINAEEE